MLADRKWVERNLGFDPITTPPPRETFTVKRVAQAAVKKSAKVTPEDFELRSVNDAREQFDRGTQTPRGDAKLMKRLRFSGLRRALMPHQGFHA